MTNKQESSKLGLLTLLASTSTLICCALPALFVAIGAGATFASMVNAFPQLVIISHYKIYISLKMLVHTNFIYIIIVSIKNYNK